MSKQKFFDEAWHEINKCHHFSITNIKQTLPTMPEEGNSFSENEFLLLKVSWIARRLNNTFTCYQSASERIRQAKANKGDLFK